mmetsp:Transcript_51964/g.62494  ORF Transcript_51964/g.62494 Transcript_51964/m.62494 type:complete len:403 (+) Transcript_51964:140-1348(+)|eukprot:CAMPEP_0172508822 /NCGR_PEP_ID=MMETSP1066-20121228/215144_1 /TAXON_ID=671091 /ORGANISM="Coscinodiscus wailesii, Strain CCMP2513" /LENGTH=402 /DNA_ID=CAMNT_0013287001 /DNA_START=140 /DNA_END=1348 /DNA_ORIENTATION=-
MATSSTTPDTAPLSEPIPEVTSSPAAPVSKRHVSSHNAATTEEGKKLPKKKKAKRSATKEGEVNILIKYTSLFLLVGQMVGLVLLMRYSRMKGGEKGDLYIASTAVFLMEAMKFTICCGVVFYQAGSTIMGLVTALRKHVWESPFEVMKLCVPSLLYTVQNNLLYLALTNLDAATYQVCYQLKILTTALFSAILLQRHFSPKKWSSLIILTIGVAIVQHSGSVDKSSPTTASKNRLIGLIAVLCAACTSGFSGVYFEKILKGSKTSLWLRNIQMGLPSIIIAYITVLVHDGAEIRTRGFFAGYSPLVWSVVTIQAAGGLIVAVVVKYADNVLKVFATSFSIIVSCVISAFVFDFRPNLTFCVGTFLVLLATVMYSSPEGGRRRKRKKASVLPLAVGGGMKII